MKEFIELLPSSSKDFDYACIRRAIDPNLIGGVCSDLISLLE
jgi:hypothetical protein